MLRSNYRDLKLLRAPVHARFFSMACKCRVALASEVRPSSSCSSGMLAQYQSSAIVGGIEKQRAKRSRRQ